MSAHNHDEEIQKQISGKPRLPTPEEMTGTQSIEKKGEYIAEQNKSGTWTIHLYNPITKAFTSHLSQQKGIASVSDALRYEVTIRIAKMHEGNSAELIAQAIESFKE